MIRKVLMSTVALVAISGTAFAADLPSRRAPPVFVPPPIPIFSWTGFYIGGQVGYGFGKDRNTLYDGAGIGPSVYFQVGRPEGIIGGAHVGYNYELGGTPIFGGLAPGGGLVVGVEGDIEGTDWRGTTTIGDFSESVRKEVEGSIRGRVGIAVDRALFYVTGGAAFTQFTHTYSNDLNGGYDNLTRSRVGWTIGGGAEYAITTQWSLRAEYRYADFGHYIDIPAASLPGVGASHHMEQQQATVGFSYKFDTPAVAPVVARY